jgi:divinyl protochlorophyllide a 8-vinyl-reductase
MMFQAADTGAAVARAMRVCDDPVGEVGLIGPGAIVQMAAALGAARARPVFEVAGLSHYLACPPDGMVPQRDVRALLAALHTMLGKADALLVSRDAGVRAANDLLAHRTARAARIVLRVLPAWLAARLLLAMTRRYAWTFCGSADFRAASSPPWQLSFTGCVLCRGADSEAPVCEFYTGYFTTLFRALVHPAILVHETACAAAGAAACVFEIGF